MSFLNGNCCLKLNYLICGSKDLSSKKKKFKLRPKSTINEVRSNNKITHKTFYPQHQINVTSLHHTLEEQNSPRKLLKCDNDRRMLKNSVYSSSLNSSIDQSHSTLNNEIIIQDVILHRNHPNERLGLTLCYGITSRSTTNIYIEHVEKSSIADCQGKLQRGDQIIKINNHRVINRDQAIDLVHRSSIIILQIVRFQFNKINISTVGSTITEDDSGVILACNTDFETNNQSITHQKSLNQFNSIRKISRSLSCFLSNCRPSRFDFLQIESRRCLSLNDLRSCSLLNEEINYSIKDLIHSQSLFEITTDNEKSILKPLPFNSNRNQNDSGFVFEHNGENLSRSKQDRRRYREERLKEQNKLLLTTDDEIMSEFKQGRYWTKEQRKKQFQRSKEYKQRIRSFQKYSINPTTEDFNLLNRIFLRENKQELKQKPYLAVKYQQQSNIEKEKLKQIIEKYPLHHHLRSQSTTTMSINTTRHHPSTIII